MLCVVHRRSFNLCLDRPSPQCHNCLMIVMLLFSGTLHTFITSLRLRQTLQFMCSKIQPGIEKSVTEFWDCFEPEDEFACIVLTLQEKYDALKHVHTSNFGVIRYKRVHHGVQWVVRTVALSREGEREVWVLVQTCNRNRIQKRQMTFRSRIGF